jgi:hypothetical protein
MERSVTMASITIQHGHRNLIFAARVAAHVGAEFEEIGQQWIEISAEPTLTIPKYIFDEVFDPDGHKQARGDLQYSRAWQSLILNKRGYLTYFGDDEIIISDEKLKRGKESGQATIGMNPF